MLVIATVATACQLSAEKTLVVPWINSVLPTVPLSFIIELPLEIVIVKKGGTPQKFAAKLPAVLLLMLPLPPLPEIVVGVEPSPGAGGPLVEATKNAREFVEEVPAERTPFVKAISPA